MLMDDNQTHIRVYRVLDEVLASVAVPPGARGAMYSIIDDLRSSLQPTEELRRAERISILLHKLEAALRECDETTTREARDELKSLAVAWLDARVSGAEQSNRLEFKCPPVIFNSRSFRVQTPWFQYN